MGAVIANLMLAALALAVLSAPSVRSPSGRRAAPPSMQTPPAESVRLPARFVPRGRAAIRTSRLAHVREVSVAVGDRVAAGQPLLLLRDLAVVAKRVAANEELQRLEAGVREAEARSAAVRQAELRVRSETVRRLEADYRAALQDFERRQQLFDEGLLARIEYERRRQDLESRRLEAEAARESIERSPVPEVRGEAQSLRKARRALERFEALSDAFVLRAPWDAVVEEIAAQRGDAPARGAVLMRLVEDGPRRLAAVLPAGFRPAGVLELCGASGRFDFEIDGRTLIAGPLPADAGFDRPCDILVERKK